MLASIFFLPILLLFQIIEERSLINPIIGAAFLWAAAATIKFKYHITHWKHQTYLTIITALISVFQHEFPNVGPPEWQHTNTAFSSREILGIPIVIIAGWYILVIGVIRLWIYLVLGRIQK
jgi:hypothetical protein